MCVYGSVWTVQHVQKIRGTPEVTVSGVRGLVWSDSHILVLLCTYTFAMYATAHHCDSITGLSNLCE